jgi:hypothetical protein
MNERDYAGALAEFAALRIEMDARAKFQQQILVLQLTLVSAILALGLSKPVPIGILMAIPLASYLLCGRYVGQRTSIQRIARYINEELSPRVPYGLGWDAWCTDHRRPERLVDWFIPLLIAFPGASLLALGWTFDLVFLSDGRSALETGGIGLVWFVGACATLMSAYLLARIYRSSGKRAGATVK